MRVSGCLLLGLMGVWSGSLTAQTAQVAPDAPAPGDAPRVAELSEKARVIVEAHSDFEPAFTPDGKKVVFVSNRDGLPQLYSADLAQPVTGPTRITQTRERVAGPLPLADGTSVLYRSDKGADENWSIFKITLDGKEPIDLTPGEKLQRDAPVVADGAPSTMFFAARKMADPASALYAQAIAPNAKPRRIYGESVPGFLLDVSADGRQALWMRFLSFSESYTLLVDVDTGAARVLYPPEGTKTRITAASFAPDGKRVFVTSDGSGTENVVLALEPATGKEVARYVEKRPATGLLLGACPSPKGDRILATVGAGDHYELRLLASGTLKATTAVKVPVGSGAPGPCPRAFSPDGKRVLVSWSTPQAPAELLAIDTGTGRATPLTRQARSTLAGLPAVQTTVVETRAFDGGRIPMLVYRPRGVRGKLPVIVSYHGGPAGASTARWNPQIRFFTSLGYAYVEPNVRGSTGYGRPFEEGDNGRKRLDAFKDIETSARWVAAQPWADKDRLVIFGGSYGGYSTLIGLTRQPDLWRAGVNLFGVADVRTLLKSTTGVIRDLFKLEFGEIGKDDEFLASISPIQDAQNIRDPLFVYAGANDPRVPRSESDMIVAAARKKGVPVEYMVKDNEGHSLAHKENQLEFYARVARFLEKHLALPSKQAAEKSAAPKGS